MKNKDNMRKILHFFLIYIVVFSSVIIFLNSKHIKQKNKKLSPMQEYCLLKKGVLSTEKKVIYCTIHGQKKVLKQFYFDEIKNPKGLEERKVVLTK